MVDNPYRAAETIGNPVVVEKDPTRNKMRRIAGAQKRVIYCILVSFFLTATNSAFLYFNPEFEFTVTSRNILFAVSINVGLMQVACVLMLAIRIYNVFIGILVQVALNCSGRGVEIAGKN